MSKPGKLTGYAAVFNREAVIAGLFREQIAPGAFKAAIGRDDCRCLLNHNPDHVLGRTTSGTLRLSEDTTGLRYEVDVPDTQWARDLMVTIKRRDISQSSFAFGADDEVWSHKGKLPLRTIKAASLADVSPVTFPAYEDTTTSARGTEERATEKSVGRSLGRRLTVDMVHQRIGILKQMRSAGIPCEACKSDTATASCIRMTTSGSVFVCDWCAEKPEAEARAASTTRQRNPEMWERLARAERGDYVNTPTPAPAPQRQRPHPAGDRDNYKTPKVRPTRYGDAAIPY